MPLSRDEKQTQTRQHLIDAAFTLISEQGYNAVSIRHIAKFAGYSQGAFYSNFESKEQLLLELMRIQFAQENQQLQHLLAESSESKLQLTATLRNWLATFFSHDQWLKVSIELQLYAARDQDFAAQYQQLWHQHYREVSIILEKLAPIHTISQVGQLERIVLELMSLSYGLALQYLIFKDDVNKYIDIFMETLIRRLEID
ncbi:TetR/AcrR family transcriptional regulator [Acinetobacter guillouiae]|uniref:TetR/AcrR family transcriptional regulator n=1 Tax=Acinetobacter guillouiae TaxID=106649 RepID=UPI00333EAD2E